MSAILRLDNFGEANRTEHTKFSTDEAVGQTDLSVENDDGFAVDKYVILREPGSEQAEIQLVSVVASNTLTVPAITYAYKKGEDIYQLAGNQIRIYRAANVDGTAPDDDDFTLLDTATIQPDQIQQDYEDSTGDSGYWYKQTYYNQTTEAETDIALSTAVRGGVIGFSTISQIRTEAGFENSKYVRDSQIATRRDDADSEILGALATANYSLPLAEVPYTIRNISRILSAGFVLWEQYGYENEGTNRNAKDKIEWAREQLKRIMDGSLLLVNPDGSTLTTTSADNVRFWPNDTTKNAEKADAGGDYKFRALDKY
jgi:hypothetical protein